MKAPLLLLKISILHLYCQMCQQKQHIFLVQEVNLVIMPEPPILLQSNLDI
jgi:hypothetical protein